MLLLPRLRLSFVTDSWDLYPLAWVKGLETFMEVRLRLRGLGLGLRGLEA